MTFDLILLYFSVLVENANLDTISMMKVEKNYQAALAEEKIKLGGKPGKAWCLTKRLEMMCEEIKEKLERVKEERNKPSEIRRDPDEPEFLDIDEETAKQLLEKMDAILNKRASSDLTDAETMAAINGKL